MRLEQALKDEAARQGFTLAGITSPDPPAHVAAFEAWLGAGLHGEMAYLANESSQQRRADPRQILPECRSILVLGVPYFPAEQGIGVRGKRDAGDSYPFREGPGDAGDSPPFREGPGDAGDFPPFREGPGDAGDSPPFREGTGDAGDSPPFREGSGVGNGGDGHSLWGHISSYAWGADYHAVLPERLERLVRFLEAQLGSPLPYRGYTDTGPLLERDLAQRAGLGWIGKNTCLIHPRLGSYFFLAELLLGVALEPDHPFSADHCGTCTRCIEACPTGCIRPDRTLDARRCIAYLTIELKGKIPPELRPQMGNWVFGCDVCQQVCPWNRFAPRPGDPAFSPPLGAPPVDLISELALTAQEFNRKFKHSPVKRAKRGGYLRNVAVVLGNLGDPAAIPALERAQATDPEPLVRQHAAWAVEKISLTAECAENAEKTGHHRAHREHGEK